MTNPMSFMGEILTKNDGTDNYQVTDTVSNDATSVSDGYMNIEYKQVNTSDTLLNTVN